jgi:hypothetical protein
MLQLLIIIALILCIVGGTNSISSSGVYQPQATTKVGVVLYVVAFILLVLMAIMAASKLSNAPSDEKMLVWAVFLAFPFILVRIIYSLLLAFSHDSHFNLITGSVVIHVFMSVVEEMIVVIIFLVIGWRIEALSPADRSPIASRPWKGNMTGVGDTQGGNESRRSHERRQGSRERRHGGNERKMRQGPIHALVGAGIAAVQEHREGNRRT